MSYVGSAGAAWEPLESCGRALVPATTMPPECPTPEELPPNEADTAGGRVSLESFADQDVPEPPQTASRTRRKPTVQSDKHFFGIKQDTHPPGFVFNDDYDTRFPDDPYGQETSAPNAKVWRVYVEEAAAFDANMVARYRDGLDVMLVFAGLFSAVVTSFLVQASQNLQADYGEMTAILLHDLVSIQLSLADCAPVVNITNPSANPTAVFVANRIDVLINGFWVVSLSAGLAVALAAVLVKQWLHHYMSLYSGTSRHRSYARHFRYTGLERWRVRIIIEMLPITMHLSLMLFLSGLILFFVPLHASLAWAVGVMTVILCALYFISNALPIFYPQCPYQTPLSDFLNSAYQATLSLWPALQRAVESQLRFSQYYKFLPWKTWHPSSQSSRGLEHDEVFVDALDWLYATSSTPVVQRIVVLAIGGLPASVQQYVASTWHDTTRMELMRMSILRESTHKVKDDVYTCLPGSESTLERVLRTWLFIPAWQWVGPTTILDTGNAQLDLALAITPMVWQRTPPSPFEMRELFISNHEIAVHPLVWNELITVAASHGTFRLSDPKVTPGAHARFIALMLPEYYQFPQVDTVSPGTLRRALEVCPPPALWDYFLEMPALMAFDVGPSLSLSTSVRALLAAAKFALHHIDERHTLPEVDSDNTSLASEIQSLWTLLEMALSRLRSVWPPFSALQLTFSMDERTFEIMQFLIMEQVVALEAFRHLDSPDHTPSVPMHLLGGCMSSVLSFCDAYILRKSYPPRHSHPTLLHIAMFCLQYALAGLYPKHPTLGFECVRHALRFANYLMAVSLYSGQHEAYCLFVQDEWMQRFGPLWIAGWDFDAWYTTRAVSCPPPGEQIIDRYVSSLTFPSMAVSRQQFINHLHEPENLAIAMCVVFTNAGTLRSLITLNPTHSSWDRCRALMESIIAWNHSPNHEVTDFPGDHLLGSKVIQCSDKVQIHLEKRIRSRFTGEEAGEKLDIAMQILNENLTESHTA